MEKLALRKSDSMYFDVLKEIGNIGTGNATTSISTMLDMKVNMQVPDAELIAIQDLNTVIGSEEEEVVGIYIRVHNGIEGSMMFLLKRAAAYFLLNRLFDRKQSYDKPFDGMDISAMEEVGNIIIGSYLTAIAKMTNLTIEPSVPYISVDMAGAILSFAAIQLGQYGDNALMIETSFEDQDALQGYLIFLPELDSDIRIFQALGIEGMSDKKMNDKNLL